MEKFLKVALEAAHEAGAVLLAEHSRPQKISYKGDVDLVTETDKRSEALIVGRLRADFREHRMGAEGGRRAGGAARRRRGVMNGTWIRWTGPRISRTGIRVLRFRLDCCWMASRLSAWCLTRSATNCFLPCAGLARF